MGSFDDLPGRGESHSIRDTAEAAFRTLIAASPWFILQRADESDYGTDCQIEVLDRGSPTNVRLHVQLKGTERALNADGSLSIPVRRSTFNYLIGQEHSLFAAYHLPTATLRAVSVDEVLRNQERRGVDWTGQETLTVTFVETLTQERLARLAGLARSSARSARDDRIEQVKAEPTDFPDLLLDQVPTVHVPDDPAIAARILEALYDRGGDAAISGSFDQFVAVLGDESDAIGFCFMAEINLGLAALSRHPERIRAGLAHFARKLGTGRFQVGSLHYSMGNAHSALGDERAAKASYQNAAGDMDFMAHQGMAAMCLKNLGTAFERLGDEETGAELFRGALAMNPDLPEAHMALGQLHHRQGRFQDAMNHYDAALFEHRDLGGNAGAAGWRLNALFNLGHDREAFRAVGQLLADADRHSWIWPWCASQVSAFGRTSVAAANGALGFWRRFLRAFPHDPAAHAEMLLTRFYLRDKGGDIGVDYARFRETFDEHIGHVAPDAAASLWERLGGWAQDLEDRAEAERCFRAAQEIVNSRTSAGLPQKM